MPLKLPKLHITPPMARLYLFFAVLLMAVPAFLSLYQGHAGQFLLAAERTRGTVFEDAVIYLLHHDGFSATGLIVNKPLDERFTAYYREIMAEKSIVIHPSVALTMMYGGPVAEEARFYILLPAQAAGQAEDEIVNLEDLQALYPAFARSLKDGAVKGPYRIYAGYAGWGPWQLNLEFAKGGWVLSPMDPALLLEERPESLRSLGIMAIQNSGTPDPEEAL